MTNLRRRIWRRLLHYRYRLLQRYRHDNLVLEQVAGQPVLVLPQVFNPRLFRTGEFMVQVLDERLIPPGSLVLDMGTGSGVGAVFAARWARRVVAVDVNPAAARCARINVLLHQAEDRIEVREGDLFAPVRGEQFDVVLFNPPFFLGVPSNELERALWSPDIAGRFAAGLPEHLAPGGRALLVLSSDGASDTFLGALRGRGFQVELVAERDLLSETVWMYRTGRDAPC